MRSYVSYFLFTAEMKWSLEDETEANRQKIPDQANNEKLKDRG